MPSLPLLLAGLGVLLGTGGCMATISGALEINRQGCIQVEGGGGGLLWGKYCSTNWPFKRKLMLNI